MKTPVVYVALRSFCEETDQPRRALLEAGCEVRENTSGRTLRRGEMAMLLHGAQAVLAGLEPYDAELLAALPQLQCISRCGVGTDAIDLEAARQQGIAVYTTPDEITEPVAQLTVAMILALARNLPRHLAEIRGGVWNRRLGCLLSEWVIGLVGYGRIGRGVERYLRVFGPRVIVADPHLKAEDLPEGVELVELPALLGAADLVSVHANSPRERGALLGRREVSQMKRGSYLVNTARGYLVEEAALYEALVSEHLAGAAVDVFETEPDTGPLTTLPQVVCTPHIGSFTKASRAAMERRCAQNVVDFFSRA